MLFRSSIPVLATEDFYYLRKNGDKDVPELKVNNAPLNNKFFNKGDIILTGNITYKNQNLGKVNLASGVDHSSKKLYLNKLKNPKYNKYLKIGAPIVILILLILIFGSKKSKRNRI